MTGLQRFILIWAAGVLVFDLIASITSLLAGIPYGWFSIVSAAIYLTVGYVGARRFGLRKAVLAAITVALVEATLGWGISWVIGPGQTTDPEFSTAAIIVTGVLLAPVLGGITGFIGGWIALKRRVPPVAGA